MTVSDEARRLLAAELSGVVGNRLREGRDVVGSMIGANAALRAIEAALSQRPSPHDSASPPKADIE